MKFDSLETSIGKIFKDQYPKMQNRRVSIFESENKTQQKTGLSESKKLTLKSSGMTTQMAVSSMEPGKKIEVKPISFLRSRKRSFSPENPEDKLREGVFDYDYDYIKNPNNPEKEISMKDSGFSSQMAVSGLHQSSLNKKQVTEPEKEEEESSVFKPTEKKIKTVSPQTPSLKKKYEEENYNSSEKKYETESVNYSSRSKIIESIARDIINSNRPRPPR